jgi:hypothetical protein
MGQIVAIPRLQEHVYLLVFTTTDFVSAFYMTRVRMHGLSKRYPLPGCICFVNEWEVVMDHSNVEWRGGDVPAIEF